MPNHDDEIEFYTPDEAALERAMVGFSRPGVTVSDEAQMDRIKRLRDAFRQMANLLVHSCPNSFELDNALARLRESMFWSINSICHE